MTFSDFVGALKNFDNATIVAYLGQFDLGELIHNPWFLGVMGGLALIALFMKWRALLATVLGTTGLTWLVSYTIEQGTDISELTSKNLLVFAGGGICLIFIIFYLLFLKHD